MFVFALDATVLGIFLRTVLSQMTTNYAPTAEKQDIDLTTVKQLIEAVLIVREIMAHWLYVALKGRHSLKN